MDRNRDLEANLREQAIKAAKDYYDYKHKQEKVAFIPGDRIPYAGRVFDENEIAKLIEASLDFWLTTGRFTEEFLVTTSRLRKCRLQ